jgi:hypothetical protein
MPNKVSITKAIVRNGKYGISFFLNSFIDTKEIGIAIKLDIKNI